MSKRGASFGSAVGRKQVGKGLPDDMPRARYDLAKDRMGGTEDAKRLSDLGRILDSFEYAGSKNYHKQGSPSHIETKVNFNNIIRKYTAHWK